MLFRSRHIHLHTSESKSMAGQSDDSPKSNLIEPMTFLKIIIFNLFYSPVVIPPPDWPSQSSSAHPSLQMDVPTPTHPHPTRPPHSLGPQVSQGLGASSLTEATPGSYLLYKCVCWCVGRERGWGLTWTLIWYWMMGKD